MSSSAFCIDAAASTVMCLLCVDGGDVTTIAYSAPPASAASMSEISSAGSSRSNCIRVPRWNRAQLYPIREGRQEELSADGEVSRYRAEEVAELLQGFRLAQKPMTCCAVRSKRAPATTKFVPESIRQNPPQLLIDRA